VELNGRAVETIGRNLRHTGLEAGAKVVRADVFRFLERAPEPHDLVYVAPPQYHGLWQRTVGTLDASPEWVAPGSLVVAQMHPREYEELPLTALFPVDTRRYGSVQLLFFRRAE
jgi:16S rRNA G966 N2-methylase RsmD